jgi:hypothetical protein
MLLNDPQRPTFNAISHELEDFQIVNCKPPPSYGKLRFAYQYQTNKLDTMKEKLLARS